MYNIRYRCFRDKKGIINEFILQTPPNIDKEVIHRIKSSLYEINILITSKNLATSKVL